MWLSQLEWWHVKQWAHQSKTIFAKILEPQKSKTRREEHQKFILPHLCFFLRRLCSRRDEAQADSPAAYWQHSNCSLRLQHSPALRAAARLPSSRKSRPRTRVRGVHGLGKLQHVGHLSSQLPVMDRDIWVSTCPGFFPSGSLSWYKYFGEEVFYCTFEKFLSGFCLSCNHLRWLC